MLIFNVHAVPPFLTAIAILSLGLFVSIREQGSRVSLLYLAYTCAASSWMLFASIGLSVANENMAYRWMTLANASVTMMPASLYHFTVVVLGQEKRHRRLIWSAWACSTLFLATSVLTDILFEGLYHYSWGIFLRFRWPAYLFMLYFIIMMVETLRLYGTEYRRTNLSATKRRRARSLLVAFGIGYLGSLDFLPAVGVSYYPMSSVPMICMLILVSRAIWRYRLVDITPAFASQEIIDNMSDALFVLDRDRVIRLVNGAACRLIGRQFQEMVGSRPTEVFPEHHVLAQRLEAFVEEGPLRDQEVPCGPGDATGRTFNLATSIIRSPAGEALATVCLVSDITERKRAEDDRERLIVQLREANRRLRSIDEVKTNFIALASHELRTPLTTIKAFIELLLIKQNLPETRQREMMITINGETDRLSRLVNDLLDLARIEAGSMKWEMTELQLEPLIQNIIASMMPLFDKHELRVSTAFDAPLSSVRGDRDRLVQVVMNLLSNAVKFTPRGGTVRIKVQNDPDSPSYVSISVADSGIGIKEEDREAIFDKFHRSSDAHTTGIEGSGLGLPIARDIVERHGGRIWATSEHGNGSTFTFTLPLVCSAAEVTRTCTGPS